MKSRTISRIIAVSFATCSLAIHLAAVDAPAATFQGFNLAPLGGSAMAVSGDGTVVVGHLGTINGNTQAFRWTKATGVVPLGDIAGGGLMSFPFGVSFDGSVIAGTGTYGNYFAQETEAFRWTQSTGLVGIGDLPGGMFSSEGGAISADGNTIVGISTTATREEAFRWTQGAGFAGLGVLPGGGSGPAFGISADGSVIVGSADSPTVRAEAFRWTQSNGMVGLGDLPGGEFYSVANAVSSDGNVVVGISTSEASGLGYYEAFRWTESGGMVGLGDFPGGLFNSMATAVSADGSVVVGTGMGEGAFIPFIWDEAHGMRSIKDVLVNEYGLADALEGWELISATGISADGRTIVGLGSSPTSGSDGWIAHLTPVPEPSSLCLLAFGFPIAMRVGRPRRC